MKQVDQERLQTENTTRRDVSHISSNTSMTHKHRSFRPVYLLVLCWHTCCMFFQRIHRKRVPELRQMSQVECGLACLAMILSYYGRKTSLSDIRMHYGVGRDGLSALGIVKAARSYGMRVRAISLQQNDFRFVALPAIVHWEFNHFLVVERWSRNYVYVVDPAQGRRRLTHNEFDDGFTGVIITLEPGEQFNRHARPSVSPRTLRAYVLQYIRYTPTTFLQLLGASILIEVLGLALPLVTKVVVDQILPFKMSNVMAVLGIGMLVLFLAQTVATLMRGWLLVYLQTRIDKHMMLNFIEHLLTLPFSYFQQRSTGDLLSRLSSNTMLREILSNQLLSTLLDCSLVIFYLFIILWQSLPFGLLTLAIGLLQILLLLFSNHPVRDLAGRQLTAQGKSQGYLTEALAGIATLKGSAAEQRAFERWSNLYFDQLNISLRYSYFSSTIATILTALSTAAPLALLWVGATQVLNGSISLGTMVALDALAAAFFAPLAAAVMSGQQLQLIGAHLERIADVTEAEPEQKGQVVQQPPSLTGHIRLENVSFRYAPDTPEVLYDLNLTIQPGQKIAVVGPSGSGKSTLGKLLLGLYIPTEGSILYDDIPLHQLNYQEVRRQFGVVLQESTLFSGSVLSNITLNTPVIDREQVIEAAKIAAIHDDILQMPMGYETFVAEGGSALSGGQRQRLAIARAITHKPTLLLLDEATSNLDVATEQKVAQNLQSLSCTQIIIAHRLSTIRNADIILVLDQGTVVERGSHHELLQRNGYYARLMRQQLEHGIISLDEVTDTDTTAEEVTEHCIATPQKIALLSSIDNRTPQVPTDATPATSVPSAISGSGTTISTPSVSSLQPEIKVQSQTRKSGKLVIISLLLLSLVLGSSLWFNAINAHHSATILPIAGTQHHAMTSTPTTGITSTSTASDSTYPHLASLYNGTLLDIAGNSTTKMVLSNIQQQEGNMSGDFIGLSQYSRFTGTITATRKVYFIVIGNDGQKNISFSGDIQSDGVISGNYCTIGATTNTCSGYGIWSVSPV